MGRTGSTGPKGGAPIPDAERVAAIRFTILDDADSCARFAQDQRAALEELNGQAARALRSNGFAECRTQLARLNAELEALDTTRLEPRRGLAGLFDSRNKRLKAFRAAYKSAVPQASEASGEVAQRGATIASRGQALDALWSRTRDAITDLDAHIVAAQAWLADRTDVAAPASLTSAVCIAGEGSGPADQRTDQPPEAIDKSGIAGGDTVPESVGHPAMDAPHPLQARIAQLTAVRTAAVANLPVLRAFQNAEHRLPDLLATMPEHIEVWRLDWRDTLGLADRKPRNVRPDAQRLGDARAVVTGLIATADAALSDALTRWSELQVRLKTAAPDEQP